MNCDQIQPDLLDYGKGLLSGPEAREIRVHIASCSECAALLEEEMSFARRLCAGPEEQAPRDVWALVRARTKPRRLRMPSFAWFRGIKPVRALAATAAAAVLAVTFYSMNVEQPVRHNPSGSSVQSQAPQGPGGQQPLPNNGNHVVAVKWSDDPLGDHSDAMVDVIDDM